MIINCSKHGRVHQQTVNLSVHLYKAENDLVTLAEVGNTVATDLASALHDMQLLRDGAVPGAAAFHHFPMSPATDRTDSEIIDAAHALRREFDPDGSRIYCIVIHGKARAGDAEGRSHGHLVLSNFDATGRAVKDAYTKLRQERIAREIEFDWRHSQSTVDATGADPPQNRSVEPCGSGRHHVSVVRALRKSRPESRLGWSASMVKRRKNQDQQSRVHRAIWQSVAASICRPPARNCNCSGLRR